MEPGALRGSGRAPRHSMTSSARARMAGAISTPSARAARRPLSPVGQ